MLSRFFPTDVRVIIKGLGQPTNNQLALARNILFKALNMQNAGSALPIQLSHDFGDVIVRVLIANGQRQIEIEPITTTSENPPFELGTVKATFGMLSGWVRDPSIVKDELQSWMPTDYCAQANTTLIPDQWQTSARLAVPSMEHKFIKPCAYSGAMKRWVQAILGIGQIDDDSPEYISGDVPDPTERFIDCTYGSGWASTNGIIKTGNKNHWLVLIDKDIGILAMPLPRIDPTTTDQSYLANAIQVGDIGTQAVLEEFGGLPSGEDFPTGTDLTDAIAAGKVLRLAEAIDLADFYTITRNSWTPYCGWAFAETLGEAHNTCWLYVDNETGEELDGLNLTDHSKQAFIIGEHWQLSINLSPHDVTNLSHDPPDPVGTGTFALDLISAGGVSGNYVDAMLVRLQGTEELEPPLDSAYTSRVCDPVPFPQQQVDNNPWIPRYDIEQTPPDNEWGATVHVFFDDDRLERVKYVPPFTHTFYRAFVHYDVASMLPASEAEGWYEANYKGNTASPEGFTSDSMEPREIEYLSGMGDVYDGFIDFNLPQTNYYFESDLPPDEREGSIPGTIALPELTPENIRTIRTMKIALVIPAFCREGYYTQITKVEGTQNPFVEVGPMDNPTLAGGYPPGTHFPFYNMMEVVVEVSATATGFFADTAVDDVDLPQGGASPDPHDGHFTVSGQGDVVWDFGLAELNVSPEGPSIGRFSSSIDLSSIFLSTLVEATGEEYVADSLIVNSDSPEDRVFNELTFADHAEDAQPYDTNWVGAIIDV